MDVIGAGFVRTDAVWSSSEPECCHAMWETSYLTWDGDTFVVRSVFNPLAELVGMPAPARP